MIDEVIQQTTTTVTVTASQLDLKAEASFWLGIFATCLSLALMTHQLVLALKTRSESRVRRLEPILREIYALLSGNWSSGVPQAVKVLEEKVEKSGLRFALNKEAPRLRYLLEKLRDEERDLLESLKLRWISSPILPDVSDFLREGGVQYDSKEDRVDDYGKDNWDQFVMRDAERAARILPLLVAIDLEFKKLS